jgi:hypothetical protein
MDNDTYIGQLIAELVATIERLTQRIENLELQLQSLRSEP